MTLAKVVREGKVAVLYSPGFGAGWFTWNSNHPEIIFHPKLVEMVEAGQQEQITEEFMQELLQLPEEQAVFCGGAYTLRIEWVPEGMRFDITEYDGSEGVTVIDQTEYMRA